MGDIAPFVSPVDGSVISGRAAMREHFKQHGVTNVADYNKPGGEWERKGKEREKFFTAGGYDTQRRREHLARAFEQAKKR